MADGSCWKVPQRNLNFIAPMDLVCYHKQTAL